MRIITIGREFGSGGRELGKRLADALGVPCYDKEIIREVAMLQGIPSSQVENVSQMEIASIYTGTIGNTFASNVYFNKLAMDVMIEQTNVIKKLAKTDCVIVGRQADLILKDYNSLNLFVYADFESKLKRCLARAKAGETEKDIIKQMKKIDKERASRRSIMSAEKWGRKENYHFCINTSGKDIKSLIPALKELALAWFKDKE